MCRNVGEYNKQRVVLQDKTIKGRVIMGWVGVKGSYTKKSEVNNNKVEVVVYFV